MLLVPAYLFSYQLARTALLLSATSTLYLLVITANGTKSDQGQADGCTEEDRQKGDTRNADTGTAEASHCDVNVHETGLAQRARGSCGSP
eukprot:1187935-Amphidinium_carterae.2